MNELGTENEETLDKDNNELMEDIQNEFEDMVDEWLELPDSTVNTIIDDIEDMKYDEDGAIRD